MTGTVTSTDGTTIAPQDRWATATMPVLAMAGGKSPVFMQHTMQAVAGVLPDAQYRVLPGQTHLLKPEAVAPVLVEFFKQ